LLRNSEFQRPGRLQAGFYRLSSRPRRIQWFGGVNVSSMEELDWQLDTNLSAGIAWPSGRRQWRLGLMVYDGRVPLGEFFRFDERYVALGWWLDP